MRSLSDPGEQSGSCIEGWTPGNIPRDFSSPPCASEVAWQQSFCWRHHPWVLQHLRLHIPVFSRTAPTCFHGCPLGVHRYAGPRERLLPRLALLRLTFPWRMPSLGVSWRSLSGCVVHSHSYSFRKHSCSSGFGKSTPHNLVLLTLQELIV